MFHEDRRRLGNTFTQKQAFGSVLLSPFATFVCYKNAKRMSSFSDQHSNRKEAREKEKLSKETLGKFFYDLAKIAFTALVVGSIVSVVSEQKTTEYTILTLIGILVTCALALIGHKIIKS